MTFGASELGAVLDECREALAGARLKNIYDEGGRGWIFRLYARGENRFLHLSAQPRFARLHLQQERESSPASPGDFCRALRSRLAGAVLEDLRQVGSDRIAELVFDTAAGRQYLVHEMFGARPEILLLDEGRRVSCALSDVSGNSARHDRGEVYEYPPPPQAPGSGGSDWLTDSRGEGEFPLNFRVARKLAALEAEATLLEKKKKLSGALKRERKRLRKILGKLEEELGALDGFERQRELGELLKGSYDSLRRGLKEVELVDYFSDGQEPVRIELDARLGPEENIERYFKRYRKARRAGPSIEKRRGEVEGKLEKLSLLGAQVDEAADDDTLESLSGEAQSHLRSRKRSRGRRREDAPSGPRSFVSSEGFTILVGRNARENDELSLRMARGNDIFLHASGRPGAHVIIRTVAGKTVPRDTLLEAAQLALYYSLTRRSSAVFVEGASADVDYAPAKLLSKPKGAPPGLVLLRSHKTLRVRLDKEIFDRIEGGR
ncbi:MAG: NFACT family protein [Planctomycetes bacterium]|nr:NFACT family protein [Planctomycetota bacterium]